jgi:DNA-binding response OmpR family regulator
MEPRADSDEHPERDTALRKVLVADDSAAVRRLVGTRLSADGYAVIEAEDGERALDLALSERPDALVLDKVMPKMDGFEVVRRLRGHLEGSGIPIIMLTERRKEEDVLDGLDLGVDEYMPKPFSPRELSVRLTRVLRRADR